MQSANQETQFVVCIKNQDYTASLETRKIYQVVTDTNAEKHQVKIIYILVIIL